MYKSYYELKITGKDVKRFIKKLYKYKIYIENITFLEKSVYIKVDKDNYKKLLNIKTIYEIEINKTYGLIKFIDVLKQYKMFLICLLINYIFILFLSNIIFEVEVLHSKKEIRDLIINELNHYDIKKFKLTRSYEEKELIKQQILKDNKNTIEWLEIERIGVKYIIRVEERIINDIKKDNSPSDIVAKKDGIIMKIEASSGEIKKKKYDYVKKGDIIISGNITKNDEIKSTIKSIGKVYAETWYVITTNIPYHYSESILTSKHHKRIKLSILDSNIYLYNFNKFDTYKENILFSITNKLLPITFKIVDEYKTNEINKIFTTEEINIEGIKKGEEKLLSFLSEDEYILSSKVLKSIEENSSVKVQVFYKVYENISKEQSIIPKTPD